MRRLWRGLGVLAVILLFATAAGAALPHYAFEFLPPHTARRSTAILGEDLKRAIDASLKEASVSTVDGARDFALSSTDKILHFGLDHTTTMAFGAVEREGNCIEYANLFAKVFDRIAEKTGLAARAYAVHSGRAQVFGTTLPFRGFGDHDWVLIQEGTGDEAVRSHVDPTLHDAGVGWDISSNVKGTIKLPR